MEIVNHIRGKSRNTFRGVGIELQRYDFIIVEGIKWKLFLFLDRNAILPI